MQTTVEETRMT